MVAKVLVKIDCIAYIASDFNEQLFPSEDPSLCQHIVVDKTVEWLDHCFSMHFYRIILNQTTALTKLRVIKNCIHVSREAYPT